MEKLLSIIIPVYNAAAYLPACLDGLIKAGVSDGEILLIDDGSDDGSLQICGDYAERYPFIRVLRQQKRSGPSAARNRGLDETDGRYVAFLDADDLIDPEAFSRTLELLRNDESELWASDFCRIAANGCVLDRICQIRDTTEPIRDPAYLKEFLSDGERVWNVWRYLFKREFLVSNGLRFIEGVDCAEDLEFVVRALCLVRTPVFFHNPYYSYRAHYGNTLTRRYTARRVRDLMEMLTLSAKELEPYQNDCASLLRDKLVKEYLLNLSLCSEVPEEEREEAIQSMRGAAELLRIAKSPKLACLSLAVRTLGIKASSSLLLSMKMVKRRLRKRKIEDFEKKCG